MTSYTTDSKITQAAEWLQEGELLCFPTDTVYALAADPCNAGGIERIYQTKKRARTQPLAVLASSLEQVEIWVETDERARRLAKQFCPGALTLVLPLRFPNPLPEELLAGGRSLGVRIPDHPVALALIEAFGRPVAATSVNISGQPAAVTAEEARQALAGQKGVKWLEMPHSVSPYSGIASTVLDLTTDPPKILREGNISQKEIENFLKGS